VFVFNSQNAYVEYKEIQAAQGVKIAAKELEKAIAGEVIVFRNGTDNALKFQVARITMFYNCFCLFVSHVQQNCSKFPGTHAYRHLLVPYYVSLFYLPYQFVCDLCYTDTPWIAQWLYFIRSGTSWIFCIRIEYTCGRLYTYIQGGPVEIPDPNALEPDLL